MRFSGEPPICDCCGKRAAFVNCVSRRGGGQCFVSGRALRTSIAGLHSARHMADLTAGAVQNANGLKESREEEVQLLNQREEVLH